jgi:hypothetical protein
MDEGSPIAEDGPLDDSQPFLDFQPDEITALGAVPAGGAPCFSMPGPVAKRPKAEWGISAPVAGGVLLISFGLAAIATALLAA